MNKLSVFIVIILFPLLSLSAQTGDFNNTGESGLDLKKTERSVFYMVNY